MLERRIATPVLSTLALAGAVLASTVAAGGSAVETARAYVQEHKQELGLTGSDINDYAVSSEVTDRHTGVTHVYLQQLHKGIEVHAAILNVNVTRDGNVLSAGNRFVANIAAAAGGQNARKAAVDAVRAAAGHLGLKPSKEFKVLARRGGPGDATTVSDGGVAVKPIEARLVWLPVDAAVRLAWILDIEEASGEHWWNAFVDATTGESLGAQDLIVHDSASAIAAAIAHPAGLATPIASFPPTDGATYRVFAMPFESPSDGDRSLVSNAANPNASPFGWHDTNGVSGPEFTITRGNNVHAYADRDNNNVVDPGSSPDGGPGLSFDFALDLDRRPLDSQPAMVTNLFYWNNIMHDVTYEYGFDEAAGNFQVNNYGKGGLGNDDVRAEAQDGSGRNNANFGTPVDGLRPRMQMFEWRSSAPNPVTVHSPSPIAGTYFGPMGGFGESLVTTGPISGEVVYVGRGCDPAYQSGQPLDPYLANPAGKIALIDRGSCTFVAKVKKAQVNGALMVIVVNNVAGPPIGMGGADFTIVIPSVMISLDDGTLFKANVPLNATVADGTGGAPDRDSDIDSGVISHEYGHGVSNRLTGGPATVSCLQNAEHHRHDREPVHVRLGGRHGQHQPASRHRLRLEHDAVGDVLEPRRSPRLQPRRLRVLEDRREQPCHPARDRRDEVPALLARLRGRPQRDPHRGRRAHRREEPVRDLARLRQARARVQREPGQLQQPYGRRREHRPACGLHRGLFRRLPSAGRGQRGAQRRQRRRHRAREVHARGGRRQPPDRLPAGRLQLARTHR